MSSSRTPARTLDPLADLKTKGPKPVYVIDGDERMLVDEAVRLIKTNVLAKGSRDFNFDAFSGRDSNITRIIEAAQTLPAFAPRRLVVVDHADKLDLENADALVKYLEDPCPTTVLLFVGEKFDARTKVYKAFSRSGVVLRYSRPKPKEMPEIVRQRARVMNVRIEESAVRTLCDTVGPDASGAFQALELLSLYVGPATDRAITANDVEALISETREESVFALADAIGKQDRPAALRGLHSMLSISREHPLRVLAMIARHYRNLARARSLLDSGVPRQDIETAVGIPSYFLDGLLGQAKRRSASSFVAGLGKIQDADRELKGGRLSHARAMERLVLALMRE